MKKAYILLFPLLLFLITILLLLLRHAAPSSLLPKKEPFYEQKYAVPEGAQILFYPLDDGLITAGYLNKRYLEKNSFNHFGTDITTAGNGIAAVTASGTGTVLATESDDNNLGSIAVIRYDNVYSPALGKGVPLIARYYHMVSISVGEGDEVTARQEIGRIDRQHKWYNHVHIELDTDTAHPFNTPQVAESSSDLLIRFPASGDSLLDPADILVCGTGQQIVPAPTSDCCEPKDNAAYWEAEFYPAAG